MMLEKQKMKALRSELMRVKDASTGPKIRQCEERFTQLVGDIFIGIGIERNSRRIPVITRNQNPLNDKNMVFFSQRGLNI